MALDERLVARANWTVTKPLDTDPDWCCARVTFRAESGDVTLRVAPKEAAIFAKALLTMAGRETRARIEDAFRPLRDLAEELNKLTGDD